MFRVFNENEKEFNNNGIKILKPLKAEIFKEDNGNYYCDFEDSIENLDYYKKGMIIQVPTPWGSQGFRIDNPEVQNRRIIVRAKHLYFDSANYLIKDSYVVDKNCNDALDHLNSATDNISPFKTLSNVGNINSYRCVRKSLEEALNTVIERWGGHLVRDNFNIEIKTSIGENRNVLLSYGKNITETNVKEDWDSVVTKILPVGKDGLLLPEEYLEVEEQLYDIPYTKTVSFNQDDIEEENFETLEEYNTALINDLRNQAQMYLDNNKLPKVNYKIGAYLQNIADVGDVILVKHPKINVNLTTNVISVKYDAINKKYKSIEFGNFKNNLGNLIKNVETIARQESTKISQEANDILGEEFKEATNKIWNNLGNGYVIKEEDRILVLDTLPKEEAKNVIVINKNGIGFTNGGIGGNVNSAWTIDGKLDMQKIDVINLVADMIKGGTLKLGSKLNESGIMELYDESNKLICLADKSGLTIYCEDGTYVKLNPDVGLAGYDINNNKIYWVDKDEFHQKKAVVEEEITLCSKLRMIPIVNDNNNGIAFVSVV